MKKGIVTREKAGALVDVQRLSAQEREELVLLGVLSPEGKMQSYSPAPHEPGYRPVEKRSVRAADVLNEAYSYHPIPASFARGMRIDLKDFTIVFLSGTASVDEAGRTAHAGDFRAQCWRTYRNITRLLDSEGATWHDIVRCTCYLRDIERDYRDFNEVRTTFFTWLGLNPLPASTGIQARLCREDLLVEIEAIALLARAGKEAV